MPSASTSSPCSYARRPALTMVEVIVVIGIIAVALSILVPAIHRIREAANRTNCAHNLQQLGLAVQNYTQLYGGFLPPGGRVRNGDVTQDQGSWLVYILPLTEQDPAYKQFSKHIKPDGPNPKHVSIKKAPPQTPPAYLRCPSDNWVPAAFPTTNYSGNLGPQCTWSQCNNTPFNYLCSTLPGIPPSVLNGNTKNKDQVRGLFNRFGANLSMIVDITDGQSTTILAGEILPSAIPESKNGWFSFDGGASHASTIIPINYPEINAACNQPYSASNSHITWGFRSRHSDGAQFVMCDGSVHFIAQTIDPTVFQYLGCRNDGQAASLP